MTYIEFYDHLSIVNICACLANMPDRVVLVGGDRKNVQEKMDCYQRIFHQRGYDVEFIHQPIKEKNKLPELVKELTKIIEKYDDCAVDLTGGEDLYLVAMGAVYQACRKRKIPLHRFNIHNNSIYDCDQDGVTIATQVPSLSVEENVRIYGGDIVYDDVMPNTTHRWDMTRQFERDIDTMWNICREDPKKWNITLNALTRAWELFAQAEDSLELQIDIRILARAMGDQYEDIKPLMEELYRKGILYFYYAAGNDVTLIFKDDQIKRCLTKAGTLLEMKVFRMLRHTQDKDGSLVYNDVMQGVFIDWDNWSKEPKSDTANEVDVLAMKGMVPVFISCKNGLVKADELYKLQSVAERFGSGYAKKILIATSLDDRLPGTAHFRQRAADMKIRIIDDLHQLSDAQIQETLKKIWH